MQAKVLEIGCKNSVHNETNYGLNDKQLFLHELRQRIYVTLPDVKGTFEPVSDDVAELYIFAKH